MPGAICLILAFRNLKFKGFCYFSKFSISLIITLSSHWIRFLSFNAIQKSCQYSNYLQKCVIFSQIRRKFSYCVTVAALVCYKRYLRHSFSKCHKIQVSKNKLSPSKRFIVVILVTYLGIDVAL